MWWGQEMWWAQDRRHLPGDHRWSDVIQECDAMPRCDQGVWLHTPAYNQGALLQRASEKWKVKSPTLNITGDIVVPCPHRHASWFKTIMHIFFWRRRVKQGNYISFFEFFEDSISITVLSKLFKLFHLKTEHMRGLELDRITFLVLARCHVFLWVLCVCDFIENHSIVQCERCCLLRKLRPRDMKSSLRVQR